MKIVVTGVAGAIGSHIAERLLALGYSVHGIDCFTDYYSPEIKKINSQDFIENGGIFYVLDLTKDSFEHVFADADIVFHMAAQPGISNHTPFGDYLDNNIVATHKLLNVVKEVPSLKMFFHASTSSIYGAKANGDEKSEPKPTSYYGVTKLAAEQLAMAHHRESDMPVCVLRFFSVYGERERPEKFFHRLIKSIYEGKEVPLYEGSEHHIRSYTYINDIVDGCILALQNLDKVNGEIFNLGTDATHTTGEGIRIIEELMNTKANIIRLPRRIGDQLETSANIQKMRTKLGYNPNVALKDGLEAQIAWYGNKIHKRK